MIKEIWIGYYRLKYEDQETNVTYGVQYLQYDLQPEEAKVFFEQAKIKGQAQFEDDYERQFTLKYEYGDDSYTLITNITLPGTAAYTFSKDLDKLYFFSI